MPVSTVDPVLYVRVVHLDDTGVDDELLNEFAEAIDKSRAIGAWRAAQPAHGPLLFEEAYRYWLGLRLPFLYRYALVNARRQLEDFRRLAVSDAPLAHWRLESLVPDELQDALGDMAVSPSDLVEGAVALMCLSVNERTSAWRDASDVGRLMLGERASSVVRAAGVRVGGQALALRALVPLVVRALETTQPVRAFEALCGSLGEQARAGTLGAWQLRPEPLPWSDVLDPMLRAVAPVEAASHTSADSAASGRCERLSLRALLDLRHEHPFLTAQAREWELRTGDGGGYRSFVEQTRWAPTHLSDAVWRDFQPVVGVYCFHRADGARRTFTAVDASALSCADAPPSVDAVHDLITLSGIVRRAYGDEPSEPRLCGHHACVHFAAGYCGTYPFVPRTPARCGFPLRAARMRGDVRRELGDEPPAGRAGAQRPKAGAKVGEAMDPARKSSVFDRPR